MVSWLFASSSLSLALPAGIENDPVAVGGSLFLIFWSALLLAGIIKCWRISRREGASALCAFSLGACCVSWLCIFCAGLASSMPVARVLLVVCGLLLVPVAGCLAVAGLLQCRKHPEYVQGKRMGIFALLISGTMVTLFAFGAINRARRGQRALEEISSIPTQRYFKFEEFNASITIPKGYRVRNANTLNPGAVFGALKARPEVHFLFSPEDSGQDSSLDAEVMASMAKAGISGRVARAEFGPSEEHVVNGMVGQRFEATVRVGKGRAFYIYWVCSRGRYFYVLSAFGRLRDRATIEREAASLLGGFRELVPMPKEKDRADPAAAEAPLDAFDPPEPMGEEYRFSAFNVRMKLPKEYRKWDARKLVPTAILGALRQAPEVSFMLIAEDSGRDFGLDSEVLAAIARAQIAASTPGAEFAPDEDRVVHGMSGQLLRYTAKRGKMRLQYVSWVCSRGRFSYQLMVYGGMDNKVAVEREAERIFAGLHEITPVPAKPTVAQVADAPAGELPALDLTKAEFRFEKLNAQMTLPKGYGAWDASRLNPAVTLSAVRTTPRVAFMLLSETSPDVALTSAEYAAVTRNQVAMKNPGGTFTPAKEQVLNGMPGQRFTARIPMGKHTLVYVYWIAARGQHYFQLVAYGAEDIRAAVESEAKRLFAGFREIDGKLASAAQPEQAFTAFRSRDFGYSVDLGKTIWRVWPGASETCPAAIVAGKHGRADRFALVPLILPAEITEPLPMTPLVNAFCKAWGLSFPQQGVKELERTDAKVILAMEKTSSGLHYEYRMMIVRTPKAACALAVWTRGDGTDVEGLAKQVFTGFEKGTGLRKGLVPEDLTPELREAHAAAYGRIGEWYRDAGSNATALPWLSKARDLAPDVQFRLEDVLSCLNALDQPQKGLDLIGKAPAALRQVAEIRSWEAWLLKDTARPEEAMAVYAELFGKAYRDQEDLLTYTVLLEEADKQQEAVALCDRYCGVKEELDVRIEQARLLGQIDGHAEALELLRKTRKPGVVNADLFHALILHHDALGQHSEVLTLCDVLLANNVQPAYAHLLKGEAQMGLKWYRKAKLSFEAALKLDPDYRSARRYLQDVSGMLGEGNNSSVKEILPPVPLPPELAKLANSARKPPVAGEYGAYYEHRMTGFSFVPGKELRKTVYRRVRLLDAGGVSQFSTISVDFDPLCERAHVNSVVVRDGKTGAIVARGKPSDYYVVDRQNGEHETHDKTLNIPIPGLAPGRVVDIVTTLQERGRPDGISYEEQYLVSSRPMLFSAVFLVGDAADAVVETANGVKRMKVAGGRAWYVEDPPAYTWEPFSVRLSKTTPVLWLAHCKKSWVELGNDHLDELKPKLTPEPAIAELAAKLTHGLDSPSAKLVALATHVQKEYTYKPIEFGTRAWLPNTAGQVVANRYGDCKDHAVLLHQLLRAAGLPSALALVNTEDDVRAGMPSMVQFDHMIVYSTIDPDMPFIDPTRKVSDLALVSTSLAGRQALVLELGRVRFERLPSVRAGSSTMAIERAVSFRPDGRIQFDETATFSGYCAAHIRSQLRHLDRKRHRRWAQGIVGESARSAVVESCSTDDLDDPSKPLVVRLSYNTDGTGKPLAEGGAIRLAAPWETYFLDVSPVAKRRTPFWIRYPLESSSTIRLKAPGGCAIVPPAGEPVKGGGDYCTWQHGSKLEEGRTRIDMRYQWVAGEYPKEQYTSFRRETEAALGAVTCDIAIRRDPEPGPKGKGQ